ncbi:hypothetical protein [Rhodococcus sp. NCIMB 12038]|uniref:hypothetical protein n=1 Tax=Rhodococcus sp. NCIMB 12038 TaxID=933800 RepID=UPI00211B1742|nr:hypothetical protein [Rhodococcus sp. NCIMB 12038]
MQAHIDHAEGCRVLCGGEVHDARVHFEAARRIYASVPRALAFRIVLLEGLGMAYELLDHTERAIECYEGVLESPSIMAKQCIGRIRRGTWLWCCGDTAPATARTSYFDSRSALLKE